MRARSARTLPPFEPSADGQSGSPQDPGEQIMRYTRAQIVDGTGFDPDARFEQVEDYNGWTNRETWAVALWLNNDEGLQEAVFEAVCGIDTSDPYGAGDYDAYDRTRVLGNRAGEAVKDYLEGLFDFESFYGDTMPTTSELLTMRDDIGSLWRVNWDEVGAAFLTDVREADATV